MQPAPLRLKQFLAAVGDEARAVIPAQDVAVVVAHPDDETIGCGALLARLADVSVIVVTDGAPLDGADARAQGFPDRERYAAARASEFACALRIAGVSPGQVTRLDLPDQQAARQMESVTASLAQLFAQRGISIVLTHAYEGGHPDHDAAAFCVRAAAHRLETQITIVEMPYYRLGDAGEEFQDFPPGSDVLCVVLTENERAAKRRMIKSYQTQKAVLAAFSLECERFRVAPVHDFSQAANGGRVLYDSRPWGMNCAEWLRLARAAQAAMAVPP
jgi:LmbE family N-acetylglucosaminyl deacetylase